MGSSQVLASIMATQTQEYKKELYQLIVAQDSLNAALLTLDILERQTSSENNNALVDALQESLIVSYGRAFTEMKPFWKLSDDWSMFDDPSLQDCHDQLSRARHKRHAHVDYISQKVVMYPKHTLRISKDKVNERTNHVVKSQHYSEQAYPRIRKTIEVLYSKMNDRIRELTIEVYETRNDFNQPEELISINDLKDLLSKKEFDKLMAAPES